MDKKPYYVLLTGGKNNAGDFLIKHRAFDLFKRLRPDRDVVDVDAWRERDDDLLSVFNGASAVILTGGPSLRSHMYPGIYKALGNIDDIKVPILTLAIGWRAFPGEWHQTYDYKLSDQTLKLLTKIDSSGYRSSVRDYHTLNALLHRGFRSFVNTGCAALYDMDFIGTHYHDTVEIKKVAFSLGVSFVDNKTHEKNFKDLVLGLRDKYRDKKFDVAFHHSLKSTDFVQAYKDKSEFYGQHMRFADWLTKENISFTDISGSAESLIRYYSEADLHIGYRVHAHIFMSSVNKLSILIAEDGRGKALRDTINGLVLDSEFSSPNILHGKNTLSKIANRLGLIPSAIMSNNTLALDVLNNLKYEYSSDFSRIKRTRVVIDNLFISMRAFFTQLP